MTLSFSPAPLKVMSKTNKPVEKVIDIPLPRFQLSRIPPHSVILLVGKRETGKSVTAQVICKYFSWIPRGVVNCTTDRTNPIWSQRVPRCFVYPRFEPESIKNLMNDQIRLRNKIKREIWEREGKKRPIKKSELPYAFIIFDDCGFDKRFRCDETLKELLLNGRHLNILVIIILQYVMDVHPALRGNADFMFLFAEKSGMVREKLYKNFGSVLPTLKTFNEVMSVATRNFGALVIDNKNNSSMRISDSIAYFKSDLRVAEGDFRMGCREFWAFGLSAGIPEEEADNDERSGIASGQANDATLLLGPNPDDQDADRVEAENDNDSGEIELDTHEPHSMLAVTAMEKRAKNVGPRSKVRVCKLTS